MNQQSRVFLASMLLIAGTSSFASDDTISKVFGGIHVRDGESIGRGETVNGGIDVGDNARTKSLSTVNGGITIGKNAQVGRIETVNGGADIGTNAVLTSIEAVNGGVDIADGARITKHISTVNGGVDIADQVWVGGAIENVNGGVKIGASHIVGLVSTATGDITLNGSRLDGGILVEKQGWSLFNFSRKPIIKIGAGTVVNGTLDFRREVDLYVHPSAKIGKVIGASAKVLTP